MLLRGRIIFLLQDCLRLLELYPDCRSASIAKVATQFLRVWNCGNHVKYNIVRRVFLRLSRYRHAPNCAVIKSVRFRFVRQVVNSDVDALELGADNAFLNTVLVRCNITERGKDVIWCTCKVLFSAYHREV